MNDPRKLDEYRRAADEIAKEKMRREMTEEPVFSGNREQRRKAKRAHDRLTRGRKMQRSQK